jgi:hypothetical protein
MRMDRHNPNRPMPRLHLKGGQPVTLGAKRVSLNRGKARQHRNPANRGKATDHLRGAVVAQVVQYDLIRPRDLLQI